jgi:hypothetical protein
MAERTSRFRVYRVVEAVPHVNLVDTAAMRLYTVYWSGYGDRQAAVDDLRTGDLLEATVSGNPDDESEAWRLEDFERVDRVEMGFAVDAAVPEVAHALWEDGQTRPVYAPLSSDGEVVGACCVQPRDPLPSGSFVPNVLTGTLPLETVLSAIPRVGEPAAEALFVDPDPPDAQRYTTPFGVALVFAETGTETADRYRERYDCPRGVDTRPEFDPYR